MRILTRNVLGAAGLYVGVATAAYIRLKSPQCPDSRQQGQNGQAFDTLADTYDQIYRDEMLMGITLLRRWLIKQAKGDVLEVSAGTGRNLGYYNSQHVNSLTMTDISKYMLWHAIQKHDKNNPKLNAKFCLADAQQLLSDSGAVIAAAEPDNYHEHVSTSHVSSKFQGKLETFNPAQFDTVVDTFGLCSHEDPKTALKQMAAVCKPGGQLILLQHGRAKWGWLNRTLDEEAPAHFAKWGCWWNRDILELVHEAGLEVDSCSRWHFGSTYVITARPPQPN